MDPLQRKKISRTMLRKHCKKLEADIDGLISAFPDDGVAKLKTLKSNYEAQIAKINAVNDEIVNLIQTQRKIWRRMLKNA